MATPDPRLAKIAEIFKLVQDSITKEEFIAAFEVLRKQVAKMGKSNETDFKLMQGAIDALSAKLKADNSGDMQEIRKECDAMMREYDGQMAQVLRIAKNLKDGEKGEDGYNGTDGVAGPKGDKGEKGDQGEPGPTGEAGTTVRVGWGAHPLTIQGLGITIDKNTRFINFKGTAVTSVTRTASGVVNVTLDKGSGSSGMLVQEETPTDAGDHVNFTLAHTPLTGTFYLWRGGARQQSIGSSPDFTQTGTALVLTNALNVAGGETLLVSYQY